MRLVKVKGIVIKEIAYKENDKIITILTDELGKISCMARGAKKSNSPILASSQYLVYSEFILYKGTSFHHINSASVIDTFYDLRIDFDKLNIAFDLTKLLQTTTDENQDTSNILKLFLNTLYTIENLNKDIRLVTTAFKIRLFALLGFSPHTDKCSNCSISFKEDKEKNNEKTSEVYYDYIYNVFLCNECIKDKDKKRYIKLSYTTIVAINYVILCDIKRLFSFELKDNKLREFITFGQAYTDCMTNGV